jgi:hypothetical protein
MEKIKMRKWMDRSISEKTQLCVQKIKERWGTEKLK